MARAGAGPGEAVVSPKIGVAVSLAAVSDRPAGRLRAAVRLVEAQGIRVSPGISARVVARHQLTGSWRLESRQQPRAVSPLGAACLAFQPLDGAEVEDGAAVALEASWDWLAGVSDGFEGQASTILLAGASRELYLDGVRVGHLLFGELHIECPECGHWRHSGTPVCNGACNERP